MQNKLTDAIVELALKDGPPGARYGDGRSLWLRRHPDGSAGGIWVFAYRSKVDGKMKEISLGPAAGLSLQAARALRDVAEARAAAGLLPDPPSGRRHGTPVDRSRFK